MFASPAKCSLTEYEINVKVKKKNKAKTKSNRKTVSRKSMLAARGSASQAQT